MPAEVTEDAVLGGKLRLKQPTGGHRFGHDAILLAAACPARAGERVVDLGAGVGAAGLALALRVAGTNVVLVEIDAALAALAAENAQLNALAARVSSLVLDVAAPASAFAAAGLESESAARVLMNPAKSLSRPPAPPRPCRLRRDAARLDQGCSAAAASARHRDHDLARRSSRRGLAGACVRLRRGDRTAGTSQ